MKVTGVCSDGFRNLEGRIPICQPLGILVGENNAGKSNVDRRAPHPCFEAGGRPNGQRSWICDLRTSPTTAAGQRVADELDLEARARRS